jgi:hypothetical protein
VAPARAPAAPPPAPLPQAARGRRADGSSVIAQIGRLQQRLAETDLHSLATQQRFLELKYKNDDELE